MSKRLEEVKHFVDLINFIPRDSRGMGEMDVVNVQEDMKWLIEQAELMQRFAKKNAELNVFLNKYSKPKHLGKNVIDVAMDIIEKQAERVQELESEIENWQKGRFLAVSTFVKEIDLKKRVQELEKQNKRYQKALEFYADEEHYKEKLISEAQYDADGICISNDEYAPPIIYFDSGEIARKALEGRE